MPRTLAVAAGALALGLSGCGGPSSAGAIAGIRIGGPLDPADPRLAPEDGGGELVLREPGVFEDRPLDAVRVDVADGVAAEVELVASARGPEVAELATWFARVCRRIGAERVDSVTPSPLGTPDPDDPEAWDPVITTNQRCDGRLDGLAIAARWVENQASDFHHARVTIRATRPTAAP